jgi:dCTP deaminase
MMLKAERVAELLSQGEKPDTPDPLVISPRPDLDRLRESGSASVDLRLGTWFVSLRRARMSHLRVDEELGAAQLTRTRYVPFGQEYFLHPRSFVLGGTIEWMRIPQTLGAYVIGRSSWGRRGLIIATATGVHPGFKGCLTLELSNVGEIPIAIKPGMKICQLFIHTVEESGGDFVDRSRFVGRRRPILGKIELDEIARRLAAAYGPTT